MIKPLTQPSAETYPRERQLWMAAFDFLFMRIFQVFSVRTCYNYMSQRVYLRKIK